MRRRVALAAVALAATGAGAASLPGASAAGDVRVVVQGLALPAGRAQVTAVGCDALFGGSAQAPTPMIGVGPATAPLGRRSLALQGPAGTAYGPVGYADAVAATRIAAMSVYAESGSSGVAYVGYQPPADDGTDLMWVGRAALSAPAGAWTPVDATGLDYTWTRYDMGDRHAVAAVDRPATVAAFVAGHGGDGYGFYALAFGCDGGAFNTDAWRFGSPGASTTYDFEGYAVRVAGGGDLAVAAGAEVPLTARVSADGDVLGDVRVVLERRDEEGDWVEAGTGAGPQVSVTVRARETTTYRWKVYSTSMVQGDQTAPFKVTVSDESAPQAPASTARAPKHASKHASKHAPKPAPKPSSKPAPEPSAKANATPAPKPSAKATPNASATPTADPASTPPATPSSPAPESASD